MNPRRMLMQTGLREWSSMSKAFVWSPGNYQWPRSEKTTPSFYVWAGDGYLSHLATPTRPPSTNEFQSYPKTILLSFCKITARKMWPPSCCPRPYGQYVKAGRLPSCTQWSRSALNAVRSSGNYLAKYHIADFWRIPPNWIDWPPGIVCACADLWSAIH